MKIAIDRAEIAQVIWNLQNAVSAGALAAAADEAIALIEALATAPALLAQTNHAATCIYCGEAVIYDTRAEADMQAAHQRLVDHDQHCPRNPLVARVAELQALLTRIRAKLAETHYHGAVLDEAVAIAETVPDTSLAYRDADQQASALEAAAEDCVPAMHQMAHWLRARAADIRRQSQEATQ